MGDRKMLEELEKVLAPIGLAGLFASICGLASYLHGQVKKHKPIIWRDAGIKALASGVTGITLMMACQAMKLDAWWAGAIIGTCSWLGADVSVALVRGMIKRGLKL